jgi:hypothetical protein
VTTTWHAGAELLDRYAASGLDDVLAASVEAHLIRCAHCREALGRTSQAATLHASLGRIWERVEDRVDPIERGLIERLLTRAGVPEHSSRLLAATRSLRFSWFAAMAVALGFAVFAARAGSMGLLLFLVVAPLVPLAGVAVAYGPGVDPAYEVGVAAPMRSFRLLLVRSTSVLVTSLTLAGIASLALPQLDWSAAAWLLPSLGLTLSSLALSTYIGPVRAATGVGGVWILGVLGAEAVSSATLAAFRGTGQLVFIGVAVGAAAILAGRSQSVERGRA